jgi:hypothetical protein
MAESPQTAMKRHASFQRFGFFAGILALAVLSCSGTSSISSLFVTQTPTPTHTFTPSPTLTHSPTSTPTQTPSPSPTPLPTGVIAEEQQDGTTLVMDYDNHYQYILPENWKIAFTSHADLQQAMTGADMDPEFADMVENFKKMDPDVFRLAALNRDPRYTAADSPTILTANAYSDEVASSMPMAFVTAMIEDSLLKDAKSTSWDVIDNGNGVEVGRVTGDVVFNFPDGSKYNVQQIVIAFQANGKLILVDIAAPQEYGQEIMTSFDGMIDSIMVDLQ